jgi:hypothetical protein
MKRLINIICALAAVFLMLAGCTKKDSVTYSGLEAGKIGSGIFTTDNGVEMKVVGNDRKYDVTTERRVLVDYTTRPGLEAKPVDIDVNVLWDALMVPTCSSDLLPKETSDAPIRISSAWFNAGYLNVLASVKCKDLSQHMVLAAYAATAEGITLRLYHDAKIEQSATSGSAQDIFACVPMSDIAVAYEHCCQAVGKKPLSSIPVLLQWTWYALDEMGPVTLYERKVTYNPSASN